MITSNLVQNQLRSANQGGECLKCSLLQLHELLSRYLSHRKMYMDSTSYISGLFPIPIWIICSSLEMSRNFVPRRSAEQIMEQTSQYRERIHPRRSNKRVCWGTMVVTSKSPPKIYVFVGNIGMLVTCQCRRGSCFWFSLPSFVILNTFCTVSDDSLLSVSILS